MGETVEHEIAYRHGTVSAEDWGGDGPPLLLTHGLGSNLRSMVTLRPHLPDFRLVAVDLPGHGRSRLTSPFSLRAGADALDAVADALDLGSPGVVGHSLGGMVAVEWAAGHPDAPGVVNLDGHGSGTPDQYVGIEPERVVECQERLRAIGAAGQDEVSEGDEAWRDQWIEAFGERFGATADQVRFFVEREFEELTPGRFRHHPDPAVTQDLYADVDARSMLDRYDDAACPVLVYSTTRVELGEAMPEDAERFVTAYRTGLARDFTALAARGAVEFEVVDTGHNLIFEIPAEIGARVTTFLR